MHIQMKRYFSILMMAGTLLLSCDGAGLTGLWFAEGGRFPGPGPEAGAAFRETECFGLVKKWLDLYFSGRDPGFRPPVHLTGSAFRRRVGEIMCEIPYGETVSYGWIAGRIAKERGGGKMSAQAVGGAVGHNPVCIIVPCHRVIGADGSLTGYAGGTDRKSCLLRMEQACIGANCIFPDNKL